MVLENVVMKHHMQRPNLQVLEQEAGRKVLTVPFRKLSRRGRRNSSITSHRQVRDGMGKTMRIAMGNDPKLEETRGGLRCFECAVKEVFCAVLVSRVSRLHSCSRGKFWACIQYRQCRMDSEVARICSLGFTCICNCTIYSRIEQVQSCPRRLQYV